MSAAVTTTSTDARPRSRRALLVGALGGIGAWAATAIGRAGPARADNGDPVLVGQANEGTSTTVITSTGFGSTGIQGNGHFTGVSGFSTNGSGVVGDSSVASGVLGRSSAGTGVRGASEGGIGVFGDSDSPSFMGVLGVAWEHGTGVVGSSGVSVSAEPKTGVYGYATQDAGSRGVWGRSTGGQGVRGQASSGVGVFGTAATGYAFRGSGRVRFDKVSGVATIAKGNVSVLVNPGVNVTSSSFVLLTPKANIGARGLWYTTNPSGNTFTIRMSSSRGSNTKVAWLLVG